MEFVMIMMYTFGRHDRISGWFLGSSSVIIQSHVPIPHYTRHHFEVELLTTDRSVSYN
jgi:hypothetical protein